MNFNGIECGAGGVCWRVPGNGQADTQTPEDEHHGSKENCGGAESAVGEGEKEPEAMKVRSKKRARVFRSPTKYSKNPHLTENR